MVSAEILFFILLHIRTNSPLNWEVIFITELCVSNAISGPFMWLGVQGKQLLLQFFPDFIFFGFFI